MKTLVIGPGRIGCGFAGQLLRASGHEVTFLGRNQEFVDHLNRLQRYRVRLVDDAESRDIVVDGVRAVSTADSKSAVRELAAADLIVTAVGAGNLPCIAPLIAGGLRRRNTPVNAMAFENLSNAGTYLRQLVASYLPAGFPLDGHGFSGSVISRTVTGRLGNPAGAEPLVFVGDPSSAFAV
jgi:mannitol-1-phosphate 5-dehydrogenase